MLDIICDYPDTCKDNSREDCETVTKTGVGPVGPDEFRTILHIRVGQGLLSWKCLDILGSQIGMKLFKAVRARQDTENKLPADVSVGFFASHHVFG